MIASPLAWFRRLTIGQKFMFSFGIMLALLALSLAAILFYLTRINSYVDRHQRITVPAIVTAAAMERSAFEMNLILRLFLERPFPSNVDDTISQLNQYTASMKRSLDHYRVTHAARTHPVLYGMLLEHRQVALAEQEDAAIQQIDTVLQELTSNWGALLQRGRSSTDGPNTMTSRSADLLIKQLKDGLDQLVDTHVKIDLEMKREGDLLLGRARLIALTLVVLLAVVIMVTYALVTRQIAEPLKHLSATADRVARQDLSATFEPWTSSDEVGHLTRSLSTMLATLRDRTLALERKTKELEAFTYSVAHDLKAPLREIEGFSSLLQQQFVTSQNPQALHYVEVTHNSALRLNSLIDALLKYSRLEQQILPMARFNLSELIEGLVTERLHLDTGQQPNIAVDLTAQDLFGEPISIRQALMNLLDNAIKFSRQTAAPEISIGAKEVAGETLLWVRDNGIGFDSKDSETIFGLFERLHPPQEYDGTGVGLAIVKLVMEKHGGRAWAESSPGKGSVFYLAFPKGRLT
ncbi:MAG: sensor histidine kinase [Nitrospiraceae bacterium]